MNVFSTISIKIRLFSILLTLASISVSHQASHATPAKSKKDSGGASLVTLNHTVKNIEGKEVSLESFRGQSLLIVNTASYCGYTKQYADLKKLQEKFADKGFTVLAFPCNDFGNQEPGSPQEIKRFCKARFDINFPLFAKVHARGDNKSPLYKTLTEDTSGDIKGEVKWNFTKFLVNPKGQVVARFESGINPNSEAVHNAIKETLK